MANEDPLIFSETQLGESDSLKHSPRQIFQNFVLVWLDSNINDLYSDSIAQLRRIISTINTFSDVDVCVDFLTEIKDEKIFLIVSDIFDQQLFSLIHDIPQLYSIYIFCSDRIEPDRLASKSRKVKGFFTKIEHIYELLQRDTKQCDNDLFPISIVSPNDFLKQDLNELPSTFLYSQILKEILLSIEHDKGAKEDLVSYWYQQYYDNEVQLLTIASFEQDYTSNSAIQWYTKQYFIYEILNRALRIMDVDIIIKMGFFLRDLYRQIEERHNQQSNTRFAQVVYRGQGMCHDDFEKLLNSKGGLLSFNNFLSTSLDAHVAKFFCQSNAQNTDMLAVLFQMQIDPTCTRAPFASLDGESNFTDEQEILFSMNTVFRIDKITENKEEGLWQVELSLTNDDDEQLRILTERMRAETSGHTGWHRLGQLMIRMGKWDKAEELYKTLLISTLTSNVLELAFLNNQLGYIVDKNGDYEKALSFYKKALEICQSCSSSNHYDLAKAYNNIAAVEQSKGNYSSALSFYQKALEAHNMSLFPIYPDLAVIYNNIGQIHEHRGNYSEALPFFIKSMQISEFCFPPNHPNYVQIYKNIGRMHRQKGEYHEALRYYQMTLNIQQKSLPPDHSDLAQTYNAIGEIHDKMGHYLDEISSCKMALKIQAKSLPSNHPDLANTYNNIGTAYCNIEEYTNALSFFNKTLDIQKKSLPSNHPDLARCYNNIGRVHTMMENYDQALFFSEQALKIFQKTLPTNHLDLAQIYNNIGSIYYNTGRYSDALRHHQIALEIQKVCCPPIHPDLAQTYSNIGTVYYITGNYAKALKFFQYAKKIGERCLSEDHPHLKMYRQNVAITPNFSNTNM